jgi:hypothetical protein
MCPRHRRGRRRIGNPHRRITRIELVPDSDIDDIRNRLAALYEARTGATPIPGIDGQQPDADLDDGPVAQREPDVWLDNR